MLTCLICAKGFEKRTRMRQRCCSVECDKEAKRRTRKNPPTPICEFCGAVFVRASGRQKFCGSACRDAAAERYHAQYREENRERLNAAARAQHHKLQATDPDRVLQKNRGYLAANRARLNAKRRTPERRAKANARLQRIISASSSRRLYVRMSANIYHALADRKAGRGWESLVGYTLADLMQHLERQFAPGMTWDNWGRGTECWHIDHIVPRCAFSFETEEDPGFRACWALTNLRPLWEPENHKKSGDRILLL